MNRRRRPLVIAATITTLLVMAVALPATAVPPTETFATFGSISEGSLDGTTFTVGGCGPASLGESDLSGAEFVPSGAATQATNSCTTAAQITIIFERTLTGVDLYLVGLPYGRCVDGVYTVTTDAAGPVTIASGFADSTLVPTTLTDSTLTVPFASPNSGVIHLTGPVTNVVLTPQSGSPTITFTLGTVHVEPTTTTTITTTTAVDPGADVAGTGATAAVTPAFTC